MSRSRGPRLSPRGKFRTGWRTARIRHRWRGIGTGTGLPGVMMVGTVRDGFGLTFAVCRGRGPAVVLDLAGQHYYRIVMTVADPGEIVSRLP